jgi:hypothetical protein
MGTGVGHKMEAKALLQEKCVEDMPIDLRADRKIRLKVFNS